jgi:hypothetical protein
LRQDSFGWQDKASEDGDKPDPLLRILARWLLDADEYGAPETFKLVHIDQAGAERPVLEAALKRRPSYYYPPDGEEIKYYVWARNWTHPADTYFSLARSLLVAELLRATREVDHPLTRQFRDRRTLFIMDEGGQETRPVWELTLAVGPEPDPTDAE